jgi:hypothetical protein
LRSAALVADAAVGKDSRKISDIIAFFIAHPNLEDCSGARQALFEPRPDVIL